MLASPLAPMVRHNAEAQRFETEHGGELCHADYRLTGNVMAMVHTEVARAARNRGVAAALVEAAVEHARRNGLRIQPVCSYVQGYMRRHPEARDVLA